MLPKITGCEPIEIRIKDTISRRYYFPELFQLRGKKLMYLLAIGFSNVTLSNRQTLGTLDVGNNRPYKNAYVTLVSKGVEELNRIPFQDIAQYFLSSGIAFPNPVPPIINREIDWTKSFIEFTSITGLNTTESILLYAFYNDSISVQKPVKTQNLIKLEDVEILVATSGLKFNFPDNEKLRGKKIDKILIPNNTITTTTPSGYTNVSSGFITLNINGEDKIREAHPAMFDKTYSFYNEIKLDGCVVDFPKSYISLPSANAVSNAAQYVKIYFHD